ncbi:hypothetical protein QQ008_11565 [Fulvivirgaceae bacterium BMA10]|uniref:Prenyltransferase n=1 Tax=Splendidivirga corallicola TaxID=3051826 RepID=A0ABT8KMQ2_9BACT|nr:hypothetical protein [Fulvivirgaceae bacterium BMA10]
MSKENHLGGGLWTTKDNRIGKGSPFSTRDVAIMLSELGFSREEQLIQEIAYTIFKTWREDGRFKIAPQGTMFPCYTIAALRALCCLGYKEDSRLQKTFEYLFDIQHLDGGWRCNKVKLGKSSNTDLSNPGTTLEALDAFRFTKYLNLDPRLEKPVEFLLNHWDIRRPLGPCHFGIGSLFMQSEFPFLRYNLFYYCHTLSYYNMAKKDKRFKEALAALEQKLVNGKLIIENPNRQLAKMAFCRKGEPSDLATIRFEELKRRCTGY